MIYLADHSLLLALPAFVPAVIVAIVVGWVARRDRREDDDTETGSGPDDLTDGNDS